MNLKGPTRLNACEAKTSEGGRSAKQLAVTSWPDVNCTARLHYPDCIVDSSVDYQQTMRSGPGAHPFSAGLCLRPASGWQVSAGSGRVRCKERTLSVRHQPLGTDFRQGDGTLNSKFGVHVSQPHEPSGKSASKLGIPSVRIYAGKKKQGDQTASTRASSPFANLSSAGSSFDAKGSTSNGAAKSNGSANGAAAKGNGAGNGASHSSDKGEPLRITNNLSANLRLLKDIKETERTVSKGSLQPTSYRKKKGEKSKAATTASSETYDDYYAGDKEVGYEGGQGQAVLLVDGYNVCGYWPKLKRYFERGELEVARMNLLLELAAYSATRGVKVVCAFDATLSGRPTTTDQFQGVNVVFTSSEADSWIEHEASELKKNGCPRIWVATSDRALGDFVTGKGAFVWSCSYLVSEIKAARRELKEEMEDMDPQRYSFQGKILEHNLDKTTRSALWTLRNQLAQSDRG